MQSVSLKLAKRLSNSSNPNWRISSNLIAHTSTTSSSPSPPSPPISAATNGTASTLNNLLTAPWSASQTRGLTFSGSDVRVGNLIENRGRAYEVIKLYNSHEGTGKAAIKAKTYWEFSGPFFSAVKYLPWRISLAVFWLSIMPNFVKDGGATVPYSAMAAPLCHTQLWQHHMPAGVMEFWLSAMVPPHNVASYATVATTTGDDIKSIL
ncbi:succinate dehydrogenase subunit 4 [Trifolium pratense]|uniref:Succinate dehydrogenase subunit 4 n=1 Tax=Trifolium pratense TaxID=57577 RepID=A0A2K3L859_TRIPR|nr:succinate dehydrogenase subunit 4 [Trifolium pratense]